MEIFLFWCFLRLTSFLMAGKATAVHPLSALDRQIPFWPPAEPWGLWLKRALFSPLFHWDATHYLNIVTRGYNASDGTTAFYPLFPWAAKLLSYLGLDPMVGLVLLSSVSGLAFLFAFEKLARLDLPDDQARWGTLFLLVFPISMVLFIPYTEAPFFLFAACCLYFTRKQRWWLASLFAVLATLTKQTGALLAVVLAVELWISAPAGERWSPRMLRQWASLLPIPAAVLAWTVLRNQIVNRVVLDFHNLQKLALSLLISSGAGSMTQSRSTILWPWQLVMEVVNEAIHDPKARLDITFNQGGYLLVVLLFLLAWRYLRPSYRIYAVIILAYSYFIFCFYYGELPVMSAFRHAYAAFPIFVAFPRVNLPRGERLLIVTLCIILFMLMVYAYALEGWVP